MAHSQIGSLGALVLFAELNSSSVSDLGAGLEPWTLACVQGSGDRACVDIRSGGILGRC